MGYKILNISEEFRSKFKERAGLEGPFFYDGNVVLYLPTTFCADLRLISIDRGLEMFNGCP